MSPSKSFRTAVQNIEKDFQLALQGKLPAARYGPLAKSRALSEAIEPVPFQTMQDVLRPLFDKGTPRPARIGPHPDYQHLRGTDNQEGGAITTLFMDIEGSTRLGLLYSPAIVYSIKNLLICSTIEIVLAFDGHVHRIMGDAVMAFFGGKSASAEQGAIDAINCAATLRYFIDTTAMKALRGNGVEEALGVRIGLDYGPSNAVLWSSYGYPGIEEVTATSFFVDSAAKLQQAAPRNQIMIGESLRSLLDFPDVLLERKTVKKNGQQVEEPFLTPNYTGKDSKPVNYRQHLLKWERYLGLGPIAPFDPGRLLPAQQVPEAFGVAALQQSAREGRPEGSYAFTSRPLPKGKGVEFAVTQQIPQLKDCVVTFAVENNGVEASKAPGGNNGNHQSSVAIKNNVARQPEEARYRGLHFMAIDVTSKLGSVFQRRVGIYVL